MKELIGKTKMSEWIIPIIYKNASYVCWFLFACAFTCFLNNEITDSKLIMLVISIIVIYVIRNSLKILYKKTASNAYYDVKHAIEMHYFEKLNTISYQKFESINKEELASKILEVAYNYTKIISDIGEYIIPVIIGLMLIIFKLLEINKVFAIITFVLLIIMLIFSYFKYSDDEIICTNYNDLLKDFINKIYTVKKLNLFSYCTNKLNSEREKDICILKNTDSVNDIRFTNFMFILISIILISSFILIKNTISRLGVIIFFIIIFLKLQDLLYRISPTIKNILLSYKNKMELDAYFNDKTKDEYVNKWKKITIKNGLVNYKDTSIDIKVPEFDVIEGDHIGIMGKPGQGKSTVLNILSGIFKMDSGDILYDGKNSKKIIDAFYSSPETDIFNISLRDNLTLGNDILDEDLLKFIDELNLNSWYASLEHGLEEIINNNLPLVIKQKINLIRAIAMNKKIYFFDEPTLDLDIENEKIVAEIIKKYFDDKTYIIVSKRPIITNLCKKHYFIKDHTLLEKEPLL